MTSRVGELVDLHDRLGRAFEEWRQPGVTELCELLQELLDGEADQERPIRLERLKQEVYRLRVDSGRGHSLVLKRLNPGTAHTDRLVAEHWLPALGLGDRCPRLLGAAAQRAGRWVWHAYEDIGRETLAVGREPWRLAAAVDLIAELHTRSAAHPLLPEIRWRAGDLGEHFFTSNLHDAIAALEALPDHPTGAPAGFEPARAGLLDRLRALRDDTRRVGLLQEAAGPETLLHGDLWPKNVFVTMSDGGPQARLIDWDHVGAGPASYDLSTFLYRSSLDERPWILQRYRERVERAGWRLPGNEELNLLFHTAESARCAHCIVWDAMALQEEDAEWVFEELMDFERWLAALRPPLPA